MKTNWQIKKLDQICEILIGGTPSRGISEYWEGGTLPWVSIRDMSREGSVINNTNEKITEKGAKNSNVKLIPKGSLLFSFKLSIGKLAIAGSDLYTNEAIATLVIKDENELNKKFLQYYISQMVFDDVTTAVKGSTLNKEKIRNLEIPVPPLETQEEIVKILDMKFVKLREAKKIREDAIVDTEKILSQTLREIFEEGKQEGWDEKSIDEITEVVTKGTTPKTLGRNFTDSGVPFLKAENIAGGPIDLMSLRTFISDETNDLLNRSKTKSGDVLMTIAGTIGRVGYLPENSPQMNTNQAVAIIRPKKEMICSAFLTYALQSPFVQKGILDGVVKAAIPNFSLTRIKEIPLPLPSLSEQQKIVTRLDELSEKIKSLRELQTSQLADLKQLEKAYLREAFNGELV